MLEVTPQPASALLEAHDKLEAAFALHQEALMLLDLRSARSMLEGYRALLAVHMRHEEEVVLVLFRRAGAIKKWPEVLYTGQHAKMNEHLVRIDAALGSLASFQGRARCAAKSRRFWISKPATSTWSSIMMAPNDKGYSQP